MSEPPWFEGDAPLLATATELLDVGATHASPRSQAPEVGKCRQDVGIPQHPGRNFVKKKSRCLENETSEEGDMCVTVNERCRGNRRRILFQRASERSSRAPERRERKKLRREIGKGLSPAPAPHPPPPPQRALQNLTCVCYKIWKKGHGDWRL